MTNVRSVPESLVVSRDPLLDGIVAVLAAIDNPPMAQVFLGRPRAINQARTAGVWYGGQLADDSQLDFTESLSDIGATERFTVGVFWPNADSEQIRASTEYDCRATLRAITKAFHANQTLGGLVARLRLGECTAGLWQDLGGIAYQVVQLTLILDTFEVDELLP